MLLNSFTRKHSDYWQSIQWSLLTQQQQRHYQQQQQRLWCYFHRRQVWYRNLGTSNEQLDSFVDGRQRIFRDEIQHLANVVGIIVDESQMTALCARSSTTLPKLLKKAFCYFIDHHLLDQAAKSSPGSDKHSETEMLEIHMASRISQKEKASMY